MVKPNLAPFYGEILAKRKRFLHFFSTKSKNFDECREFRNLFSESYD